MGITVINNNVERAIRKLRKYVERERILSTYSKKRYHMSKGEKRRAKKRRAALLRKKKKI